MRLVIRSLVAFCALVLVAADARAADCNCAPCSCGSQRQRWTPVKNLVQNVRDHRAARSEPVAQPSTKPVVYPIASTPAVIYPTGGFGSVSPSCPNGQCPVPTQRRGLFR